MVKANVLNTPLLPVIIVMAVISVVLFSRWAPEVFETNKSFDKINRASRSLIFVARGLAMFAGDE